MNAMRTALLRGLFVASLLTAATAAADRANTDVIALKNGDHVTGEIRKLEFGRLQLETDDMGTISIEWSAIASIDTQYTFDVEQAGGRRYAGLIATSQDGSDLVVRDDSGEESVPLTRITRIT